MGQGGGQGKGGGEGAGQIHSRKKPSRWLWYTPLGITRPTPCSSPSHQAVPTLIVLFKLHFGKWICREAKLGRKGLYYEFRLGEFSGAVDVFRHWMWRLNHMHSLKLTQGTFTWANFATCKLHLDEAAKKRIHPKCVCGQGGLGQRVQTNCAFSTRRPQLPLGSQRVVSHPPGLWVSAIFGHLYHLHPTTSTSPFSLESVHVSPSPMPLPSSGCHCFS